MRFWDGRRLTLWHGTTKTFAQSIKTNGPDPSRSRAILDFGPGFYLTTKEAQAVEWARRVALDNNDVPFLMQWNVDYEDFASQSKLAFADNGKSADDFWDFVKGNREDPGLHRSSPLGNFEVVFGPVARNYKKRYSDCDKDQVSFDEIDALWLLDPNYLTMFAIAPP